MTHELHATKTMARRVRSGFTLIELLIGITIIGIMAGGIAYTAMTVMAGANRTAANTALQTIKSAIDMYKNEKGDYPKSLQQVVDAGMGLKKAQLMDPWGKRFQYTLTSGENAPHPYELYSYGPDGPKGKKASRISAWKN